MPAYHIELRTADQICDTHKVEKENLEALRIEMARFVGDILKEHAGKVWADKEWRVDVTDEIGLILHVMTISATDTAATMPFRR